MVYAIYKTEAFAKIFESLEVAERDWITKIVGQLKENPHAGKPLGFPWFREKKFGGKRLYYLIYNELGKILIVAFGNKKEQKLIIQSVLRNLDAYNELAEKL